MVERVTVRRGTFLDSVALMLVSRDASELDGVEQAQVVNATPLNLELLERQEFALPADEQPPGPNDLLIAIRADGDEPLAQALALVEERLRSRRGSDGGGAAQAAPRSVTSAVRRRDELSVALVSVPGRHAAYECARALDAGLDVLCFSSGPSLEVEAALKARANALGLLMMGPDCGTAILGGVALGFGNAVRPGPVGIVGASGTGIQAIACRLDAAGIGISQAIGTGGRDLSAQVGAATTLRAIELLADDAETEAIVVVAKSPDPAVAERVAEAGRRSGKRLVLALPGFAGDVGAEQVGSLEGGAAAAAAAVGASLPPPVRSGSVAETPGAIRGLFSGGTLRDEALAIVGAATTVETRLDPDQPGRHLLLDLGDERFTEGRPHPMIDLSLRISMLHEQALDPSVGVLLLDVVLGYGAHPDPAAELAPALARVLERRRGELSAVVSVCGTDRDPQGAGAQAERLHEAGAVVTRSNADAAELALAAAGLGSAVS